MRNIKFTSLIFTLSLFSAAGCTAVDAQPRGELPDSFRVGDLIYSGHMINWRKGTITAPANSSPACNGRYQKFDFKEIL